MNGKNLFDFFGLSIGATEDELKKRYRELVKEYHPDKNKSEDAKTKFQELKQAYEDLILVIRNQSFELNSTDEDSVEEQWKKYRERARKITQEKQRRQVEAMNAWYDKLQTGSTWKYTKIVCFCSGILILLLLMDNFLPCIYEDDFVVGYDAKNYHSIDEHHISRVITSQGDVYWLDRYNNGFFSLNPFVKIQKTRLLHSPISFQKFDGSRHLTIPIELTIYWAQIMIFIAFLISVGLYFYRKRDVFFIMGSYFTRFFTGPFIVWFLLSNNRWIHVFTLGFL
jgi:curved DNA-binding protein CbpA